MFIEDGYEKKTAAIIRTRFQKRQRASCEKDVKFRNISRENQKKYGHGKKQRNERSIDVSLHF